MRASEVTGRHNSAVSERRSVEEVSPGLWTWTAPHPDWTPEQGGPDGWERDVRSCAVVADGALVVLDPMELPEEIAALADGRAVSVVLTCAWHRRSAADYVERLAATVYAPRPGIERLELAARPYDVGDELPGGVVPAGGYYPEEVVLWLAEQRTLFAGDAFTAPPLRFHRAWLPEGVAVEDAVEQLRPLANLPVEVFVVGHGDPVTKDVRATLRRELGA